MFSMQNKPISKRQHDALEHIAQILDIGLKTLAQYVDVEYPLVYSFFIKDKINNENTPNVDDSVHAMFFFLPKITKIFGVNKISIDLADTGFRVQLWHGLNNHKPSYYKEYKLKDQLSISDYLSALNKSDRIAVIDKYYLFTPELETVAVYPKDQDATTKAFTKRELSKLNRSKSRK